jgi:superfamily II DNA/RNA helicase
MPKCFEDFVHKVGRTGRAGNAGNAITFFDKCIQSDMCMAQMLAKVWMDKELNLFLVQKYF